MDPGAVAPRRIISQSHKGAKHEIYNLIVDNVPILIAPQLQIILG